LNSLGALSGAVRNPKQKKDRRQPVSGPSQGRKRPKRAINGKARRDALSWRRDAQKARRPWVFCTFVLGGGRLDQARTSLLILHYHIEFK
jgi:hypothetical protein